MNLGLEGKTAIVTGGSRGIGFACAVALADAGCNVAICGRNEESLLSARRAFEEMARPLLTVRADVTQASDASRFVEECVTEFGSIDGLVNNVGGSSGSDLLSSTDEDWRETFERNLFQSMRMVRLVAPHMVHQNGGSVVNIASISGWQPQLAGTLQYGAAKAALVYLAEPLALTLASDNIRVNTVSPGSILWEGGGWSRFRDRNEEDFRAYVENAHPAQRLGNTDEVADVVAFLVSERASWINGRHIPVDGLQQPVAAADRRLW